MDYRAIENEMKVLCQSKKWKDLTALIDDGYKGIFVILRILQASETSVVAGELSRLMNVSTARIARALNTLESKNYIRRERDETDARKVVIRLTETGEQALEERKTEVKAIFDPMFANLTEQETSTLFYILKKMLQ